MKKNNNKKKLKNTNTNNNTNNSIESQECDINVYIPSDLTGLFTKQINNKKYEEHCHLIRKLSEDIENGRYSSTYLHNLHVQGDIAIYAAGNPNHDERLIYALIPHNGKHVFVLLDFILSHKDYKQYTKTYLNKLEQDVKNNVYSKQISEKIYHSISNKKMKNQSKDFIASFNKNLMRLNVKNSRINRGLKSIQLSNIQVQGTTKKLPVYIHGGIGTGKTNTIVQIIIEKLMRLQGSNEKKYIYFHTQSEKLANEIEELVKEQLYDKDLAQYLKCVNTKSLFKVNNKDRKDHESVDEQDFLIWLKDKHIMIKSDKCKFAEINCDFLYYEFRLISGFSDNLDDYLSHKKYSLLIDEKDKRQAFDLYKEYKNDLVKNKRIDLSFEEIKIPKNCAFFLADEMQDLSHLQAKSMLKGIPGDQFVISIGRLQQLNDISNIDEDLVKERILDIINDVEFKQVDLNNPTYKRKLTLIIKAPTLKNRQKNVIYKHNNNYSFYSYKDEKNPQLVEIKDKNAINYLNELCSNENRDVEVTPFCKVGDESLALYNVLKDELNIQLPNKNKKNKSKNTIFYKATKENRIVYSAPSLNNELYEMTIKNDDNANLLSLKLEMIKTLKERNHIKGKELSEHELVLNASYRCPKKIDLLTQKYIKIEQDYAGIKQAFTLETPKEYNKHEGILEYTNKYSKENCEYLTKKFGRATDVIVVIPHERYRAEVEDLFTSVDSENNKFGLIVATPQQIKGLEYRVVIKVNPFGWADPNCKLSHLSDVLLKKGKKKYSEEEERRIKLLNRKFLHDNLVVDTRATEQLIWIEDEKNHQIKELINIFKDGYTSMQITDSKFDNKLEEKDRNDILEKAISFVKNANKIDDEKEKKNAKENFFNYCIRLLGLSEEETNIKYNDLVKKEHVETKKNDSTAQTINHGTSRNPTNNNNKRGQYQQVGKVVYLNKDDGLSIFKENNNNNPEQKKETKPKNQSLKKKGGLHAAIRSNDTNKFKEAFNQLNDKEINAKDKNGNSALHIAMDCCNEEAIKALLDKRIDQNIKNNDGYPAIFIAFRKSDSVIVNMMYVAIMTMLLEKRKDINFNLKSNDGTSLLMHAILSDVSIEMISKLLEKNIDIDHIDYVDKRNALMLAVLTGREDAVKILLSKGAKVNHKSETGETALHLAVKGGNVNIVKLLLTAKDIDVNCRDKSGNTPLHYFNCALQENDVAIVQQLCEHGCDTNKTNRDGVTALMIATDTGDKEVVEILLKHKADVNIQSKTQKMTALEFAIKNKNLSLVRILLDVKKIDLGIADENGVNALFLAAEIGHTEIFQLVLNQSKHIINNLNYQGKNVIFNAMEFGHDEIVKILLLQYPELINSIDSRGFSSLDTAVAFGNVNCVRVVVESNSTGVNKDIVKQALFVAIQNQNKEKDNAMLKIIGLLLDYDPDLINATYSSLGQADLTPLAYAVTKNNENAVSLLLKKGANINHCIVNDGVEYNPLMLAITIPGISQKVVKVLLIAKVDLCYKNRVGTTLDNAIAFKNKTVIEMILTFAKLNKMKIGSIVSTKYKEILLKNNPFKLNESILEIFKNENENSLVTHSIFNNPKIENNKNSKQKEIEKNYQPNNNN